MLGLCCFARAFFSGGGWGRHFVWCTGFSPWWLLLPEHRLWVHGLQELQRSGSGVVVQGPRCMWDLPGPGIELTAPALAGGFLPTVPPGNS